MGSSPGMGFRGIWRFLKILPSLFVLQIIIKKLEASFCSVNFIVCCFLYGEFIQHYLIHRVQILLSYPILLETGDRRQETDFFLLPPY